MEQPGTRHSVFYWRSCYGGVSIRLRGCEGRVWVRVWGQALEQIHEAFACVARCLWLGALGARHGAFPLHHTRSSGCAWWWGSVLAFGKKSPPAHWNTSYDTGQQGGRKQLPSDRAVSVDTLMPLECFPRLKAFVVMEEEPLQSPHKGAAKPAAFLAHALVPLFLQAAPITFDVAGFSFPNTFSLASSLSHFLYSYPAVKLHCSPRLRSTLLQEGDLQHFAMRLLYKN